MLQILRYLLPYKGRMSVGLTIKVLGTVSELFIPWILAYMIDTVVPLGKLSLIIWWGVAMIVIALFTVIANIMANRMAAGVARDAIERIRHDLFAKISYLSSAQVDEVTIPSLISRLTTDSYNIHQMLGMMQRMGIRAPILLLGGAVVTLTLDPVLALVLMAVLPFITLVVFSISRRGIPLYRGVQKAIDEMVRIVRECASGIRVIKALSKVDYEKAHFDAANRDVAEKNKTASVTVAMSGPAMNFFLNIGLTLVIVVGAIRVNAGLSEAGKILAFMTYFTIILNAMMAITRIFMMISKASASAGRICLVLNQPRDLLLEEDRGREETGAHIEFRNVSFSYGDSAARQLKNVSFSLPRGGTLGIIGETGSGKSTLIQLLMRFYDASEGEILIDGRNIRTIPEEELHTMFGVTFQKDVLFADTIRENISFGRDLSDEAIEKAAEYAQAKEFIDALPDRYEHMLTAKGTNLSGGQKQRVLIARALAGNPEILILDDASSALDYRTDARLRTAIREHFSATTTVMVAQRISSVMHADVILVLEKGEVIGLGSHEELMASCESYREISQSQIGGGRG